MYDAIVIGGGLAGCSAAIQMAEQGYRVLLLEKGTYPKHKLCGEFLSPEVQASFERLGVLQAVQAAGAHSIERTHLTAPNGASFRSPLPGTALGLSRYRLDHLLFEHACACGADGRDGTRVRAVSGSLDEGFVVETGGATFEGRVLFGAYGRRGVLDRTLNRSFLHEYSPYVAFKAHYTGIACSDQIELHAFPGGYCGLARIEDGRVNVCWISHEEELKAAGGTPEAMIERALVKNDALGRRLERGQRLSDSFLAVSQVSLSRKSMFENDICMIGDTAGMIAPLCGDGMAMALRSAELAVPPAADFLDGRCSAETFQQHYADAWDRAFRTRMRLGRWIHGSAFRPGFAAAVVRACHLVPALGRWLIQQTRG